ncbi:MAG: hypothetical protein ABIV39_09120 [Verrucomicrobiota bacterium]
MLGVIQMRAFIFSILLLVSGTGCAVHRDALMKSHRYRIFFPHIELVTADGERIESIEVRMTCGRFRAIGAIPNDWSAEVVSPMSEQTTLRASAGHGSSTLWSMRELDGAITVSTEEASCFDIAATVGTTATEHRFTRSDLILKP